MLDFHNHLIPGVDDGAASLEEALGALGRMRAQGVTHVITTPHFQASLVSQPAAYKEVMTRIDDSWRILQKASTSAFPDVQLSRGVELALDEPIDAIDDDRLRLAGSRFVLVEFPYFSIPPQSGRALARLAENGITPIVAHPERYRNVEQSLLGDWKAAGAFLQVNAGSFANAYGHKVEKLAWGCLESGVADFLCSDYHARGICLLESARNCFDSRGAGAQFDLLARVNGDRLRAGLSPMPVPRVTERRSRLHRLARALRGKRR